MLKIKRKVHESFTIGNDIKIRIERTGSAAVHLLVDAPRNIPVLRTELIEPKRPRKLNVQAKLKGSKDWHDYGNISMVDAARLEAIETVSRNSGLVEYEWLVYVRIENDNTTPSILARVQTFVGADVVESKTWGVIPQ